MVAWFGFFDIGINNGLKNKLAEALAKSDFVLARKYVSSTYAILSIIFIPLMALGIFLTPLVNWQAILHLDINEVDGFSSAMLILISYFCIQFILSTINIVLLADQRPAESSLRTFIQNIVSFCIIGILTFTTKGNLTYLCLALCISPLAVLTLFNVTLFNGRYRHISPSVAYIDLSVAPKLMKLGGQFFVIQIAAVIQFQMMNFIILRYYGASDVAAYNIAQKYFNVVYMLWGIVLTPLWAATTNAIAKEDYQWIINAAHKCLKLFLLFSLIMILLLLFSSMVYSIWIGDKVFIPFSLSFWMMLHNMVLMFGSTFVYILNGAGLLRVQTMASLFSPLIFLAISYLLISLGTGPYSVLIAAIIANFNGFLLAPIQFYLQFISPKKRADYSISCDKR